MWVTQYRLRTVALTLKADGRPPSGDLPRALGGGGRAGLKAEGAALKAESGSAFSLQSSAFMIGFVGRCAFSMFRSERALWRTLHLLADFAFYCGTGYKTTQGLGQTRKVPIERVRAAQ